MEHVVTPGPGSAEAGEAEVGNEAEAEEGVVAAVMEQGGEVGDKVAIEGEGEAVEE